MAERAARVTAAPPEWLARVSEADAAQIVAWLTVGDCTLPLRRDGEELVAITVLVAGDLGPVVREQRNEFRARRRSRRRASAGIPQKRKRRDRRPRPEPDIGEEGGRQ